jgi:hypothetical protein
MFDSPGPAPAAFSAPAPSGSAPGAGSGGACSGPASGPGDGAPGAGGLWTCALCGVDCGAAAAPLVFDVSMELADATGARSRASARSGVPAGGGPLKHWAEQISSGGTICCAHVGTGSTLHTRFWLRQSFMRLAPPSTFSHGCSRPRCRLRERKGGGRSGRNAGRRVPRAVGGVDGARAGRTPARACARPAAAGVALH